MYPRSKLYRHTPLLGLCSALAIQAPSTARADQGSGTFSGRVVDAKTGEPIADALVLATSNSLQGEQSVTTDASGYYRLPHLPAGIYNLQFFAGNYAQGSRSNIRLASGAQLRADMPMVPEGAAVRELIVERPVIDATSSANQTNVSQELMRTVPLVAPGTGGGAVRSFEAIAAVAPGARPDAFGTSLGGTTSPENSYVVNGVNTGNTAVGTNASPLSTEFLQEVQILTGAYMPEFGMNTGGTISAIVKQGDRKSVV